MFHRNPVVDVCLVQYLESGIFFAVFEDLTKLVRNMICTQFDLLK